MSVEPFNRLVKLVARAFYDDKTTKGDNQPKVGRGDNHGIGVVVLDSLTRRQWVKEDDLSKCLKVHSKQLRKTLRFFEEEKLVSRVDRKEGGAKEGEEKIKPRTHSYWNLDYAQIYDVVRYRLHRMKKKLKDELDNKNTVPEYICSNCKKRYNALDALQLISPDGESFQCESCNGELVEKIDKLAAQEVGDGNDNARRRRHEEAEDMLKKIEVQLKPIMEQLNRVKDLPPPEFETFEAHDVRRRAAGHAAGDSGADDSSKSSQGLGYGGTPMPFIGESTVEVAFNGVDVKDENTTSETSTPLKVLPPWMIKEGMKLTKEQRGEVKQESKMASSSTTPLEFQDDKKSSVGKDDKKNKQNDDDYLKAYYAAILEEAAKRQKEAAAKRQQELSNSNVVEDRQVGIKSKREEDEADDGVEWEEASTGGGNNTGASKEVNNLNVEGSAAEDNDEDDIDWEEG